MSNRDPFIENAESLADADNARRADEYWDIEEELGDQEDTEEFDEATGPTH